MPATSQSPIPAVLLQGFLGAGKTTLLRSLLVEARKRDLSMGLVVNDMSDLDVDGQVLVQTDIVDHDAAYFHSIHSCVLSSKRGIESLREALSSMRKKQPPDLVIVESSGSSHPLPLVEFFQAQRGFLLTGVLTLVDAAMIDEDYASGELIVDLFEELDGYAVGDGYSGHKAAAKIAASRSEKPRRVRMGGCWAHVNRKFKDAASEAEKTATLFRKDIQALYAIDRDAKMQAEEGKLSHEEHLALRLELRRERAPRILLRIYRRARKLRKEKRFSDACNMDNALKYVVNQRAALSRFLADARIALDNNSCERAIRPLAIGRRNWLFAGSERGGKAAAVIYTLIESCKIAKLNPQAYLADVLVRISTHPASRIEELLPSNWTKLRRREARAAA
jgi:molybdopterin-guanine dinucleotide biosynthesis protein